MADIILEPEYPDFEVVIATFERPKLLRQLIGQIRDCHPHKRPRRVLVVDDCSGEDTKKELQSVREELSGNDMRVSLLLLDQQVGYYAALRAGLSYVETDYAVCCTDDIRLAIESAPGSYVFGAQANPLLTLAYYLAGAQRVVHNMSQAEEQRVPYPVGLVFPWVGKWESPDTLHFADAYIFAMRRGILPIITNEKGGFNLHPLTAVDDLEFYETSLGHRFCFGVNMLAYREVGGFDPRMDAPQNYGIWHLGLMMRNHGHASYSTNQSVIYHRTHPYPKNEKSLMDPVRGAKSVLKASQALFALWGAYKLTQLNRPINPDTKTYLGMMDHGWSG